MLCKAVPNWYYQNVRSSQHTDRVNDCYRTELFMGYLNRCCDLKMRRPSVKAWNHPLPVHTNPKICWHLKSQRRGSVLSVGFDRVGLFISSDARAIWDLRFCSLSTNSLGNLRIKNDFVCVCVSLFGLAENELMSFVLCAISLSLSLSPRNENALRN